MRLAILLLVLWELWVLYRAIRGWFTDPAFDLGTALGNAIPKLLVAPCLFLVVWIVFRLARWTWDGFHPDPDPPPAA
ncbi:MAG TPA: hypothetical protein VF601_08340 [Beijerinckiaceae bacterium]